MGLGRVLRFMWRIAKWGVVGLLLLLFISNGPLATARNTAYRSADPNGADCSSHPASYALAEHDNDEELAIDEGTPGEHWQTRFACPLQTHALHTNGGGAGAATPLHYHLAFLEYGEDGTPLSLAPYNGQAGAARPYSSQLDILKRHLAAQKANYVVVFVHGWRHDASIGDGNVADARVYGANVARFIADRCEASRRPGEKPPLPYCDMEVTVVYVGWRGARVAERWLTHWLGPFGTLLGEIAAMPTLFDRKPVSEAVGPAVATALHSLSDLLDKSPSNRMIVFGHSLGGNLLMTAMQDNLVKAVYRHPPGSPMRPPFGDLIVLINPASEAAHWTAIQREVWKNVAFTDADVTPTNGFRAGQTFFPQNQRPVLISVTAAHVFPPAGIRTEDCFALLGPHQNPQKIELINESRSFVANGIDYDWATYDLFPLFKGDPRPVAGSLARWAARHSGDADPYDACAPSHGSVWSRALYYPAVLVAEALENVPFASTDLEQTRTIGNLDPPRPAYGSLAASLLPYKMFGTTHELIGRETKSSEQPSVYAEIGEHRDTCPIATNWLYRARTADWAKPNGVDWRSDKLAPGVAAEPAAVFIHGFGNAGLQAITRPNDPFWNMRAFHNALARHDGYLLTSFICAMNQLVLDEVTPAVLPTPPAPTTTGGSAGPGGAPAVAP